MSLFRHSYRVLHARIAAGWLPWLSPENVKLFEKAKFSQSHLVSELITELGGCSGRIAGLQSDLKDKSLSDLKELIIAEIHSEEQSINILSDRIRALALREMDNAGFFSEDKLDARLEVRAGVGGDEALKWAQELFHMYAAVSAKQGWEWEPIETDSEKQNIFKAIIKTPKYMLDENLFGAYGWLRFESGVHRVQRIPFNSDRMQTSAAAVVVLPKIEIQKIKLKDADVKISISKKSSGAGGQSVNAAYQQVTLKHLPTGFTVTVADSHAQQENKEVAYARLTQKIQEFEEEKVLFSLAKTRKAQSTTADRSEKIRTYNFQRGEVNDHRVTGCVVKEDMQAFMQNPDGLLNTIWEALARQAENEAIVGYLKSS